MFPFIDWPVLARQAALIAVPLLLARLNLPPELAGAISEPAVAVLSALIVAAGSVLVGWVVYLGQRREQPAAKIEAVAEMPEVRAISLNDADMAADIPSGKVIP